MILGNSSHPQNPATAVSIPSRSYQVVQRHPQLIVFPLITILACGCMVPVFANGISLPNDTDHRWLFKAAALFSFKGNPHPARLVGYYFSAMFWATLFNVAFYREVMRAYAGERPSVSHGLRVALGRLVPIISWTLFASSIGILIRVVSQRFGWATRLFGFLGGVTWSIAAVFAIPVLIRDGTPNPAKVLRHSSETVRQTWGNLVWGLLGLNLGLRILTFASVAFLGFIAFADPSLAGTIAGIAVVALLLAFYTWNQATQGIFLCALYIYATEGVVPEPFVQQDMDAAWKIKGS